MGESYPNVVYNRRRVSPLYRPFRIAETTNPERAARRREWLGRALFESGLILFGILGAFAVNEWQASRERQARVKTMLTAIQAELESNLRLLEEAFAYNGEVVANFRALAAKKATTIPGSAYPRGLMIRPQLVSAAWDSAQAGGIINDLPVETVLLVATAYENQRDYAQATASLLDIFYSSAIQRSDQGMAEPGRLGGILNDYAGRGRRLIRRYQETLAHLRGEAPPAAPK